MTKYILILCMLIPSLLWGIDLKVEYSPKNPRAGEAFQIFFIVSGEDVETLKEVEFTPLGFEILSKDSRTTNTRTTYINGKLTTYKSQTISYDVFVPEATRKVSIQDLALVTEKERIDYDNINIRIQSAVANKNIYLKAVIEDPQLYVGQGSLVSYYLYSKTNSSSIEIKKFPVLKSFLKRFRQDKFFSDKREIDGEVYTRTHIYSAYVFPQKSGRLIIDPITVSARIATGGRSRDVFDVFGFALGGGGRRVRRVLRSEPLILKIKELPKPVPANFTGLVGNHDFQLRINKDRFLANEPIEIKLTVEGDGELEALDAPEIFNEKLFEKFDSDGKLSMGKGINARKEFSYTYLAKITGNYKERILSLSSFNPQKNEFITHDLVIPALKVAGGIGNNEEGKTLSGMSSSNKGISGELEQVDSASDGNWLNASKSGIYAPYFEYSRLTSNWTKWLSYCLFLGLLVTLFSFYFKTREVKKLEGIDLIARKLKKNKWKYSDLYTLLDFLRVSEGDKSIVVTLNESRISKNAKKYFSEMMKALEQTEFDKKKKTARMKISRQYIEEVVKAVKEL